MQKRHGPDGAEIGHQTYGLDELWSNVRAIGAASQYGAARDDSREGSARDRPGNAPASILDRDHLIPSMSACAADEKAFRADFQREGHVRGAAGGAGRSHT
jgi:hypothetical protein